MTMTTERLAELKRIWIEPHPDREEPDAGLVEAFAALLPEFLQQVAQALHAVALLVAHPALHQVAQGVLQVAEIHDVVGQGLDHLVGVESRDRLRAVPFAVPVRQRHGPPRFPRAATTRGRAPAPSTCPCSTVC